MAGGNWQMKIYSIHSLADLLKKSRQIRKFHRYLRIEIVRSRIR